MRVISGKYKGRTLIGYDKNGTRPTMDRIKESVFAMIQDKLKGSIVLDLFAGSGSLGIEALSNGARVCYFVDNNKELVNIIRRNTKDMTDNIIIIKNHYLRALDSIREHSVKFDIVFLDPPYKYHLINNCLDKIVEYNLLNKDGIIICEYEDEIIDNNDLISIKEKEYGNKKICILKRKTI